MGTREVPLCVLFQPSLRGIAYLERCERLGLHPQEVVVLGGEVASLEAVRDEDGRWDYGRHFFDVGFPWEASLEKNGVRVVRLATRDVNGPEVREALRGCESLHVLFTSGGILEPATLACGKRFVHVHPGIVPRYRGSTCFYYSLLEEGALGATAFIMDERIDTGPVITTARFTLNYQVSPDQPLFVDYVLDPALRALVLERVLRKLDQTGELTARPQTASGPPAYFVMHPALRHCAVRKINTLYDPARPAGLSEAPTAREGQP